MRMREIVAAVGGLTALGLLAQPALAQTILKTEPYHMAPFAVVYVDNGKCMTGQVMKITGGIGALHRKKLCVPLGREEASLVQATP